MSEIASRPLFDDRDFAVRVDAPETGLDLAVWSRAHLVQLEALAARHPVILLRGFELRDEAAFARVRDVLVPKPAAYMYRSTPRVAVAEGIMTATEYPASEEIPQHCENAYQRDWPMRLLFCCLVSPETGGQTPLSDVAKVTARIDEADLDLVEARGIRYIRNYHTGFDLDWRTVFQTDQRTAVEAFCDTHDISFEWLDDGRLRTTQVCQGTARRPTSAERLWFNQAQLFHPSALGPEMMEDMLDIFGVDELPRDARLGDGAPISPVLLDNVRTAFAAEARDFDWRAGDVMIVDNMRAAHGRRAFTGHRRVLVSMGAMYSEQAPKQ
ncbi:MAG: TauD/TfdA family dioxygenase [Proteobacteria bacterium]|nr:TauD/TfdA family dioxygenase [Pseudomonadota bacterium]MDA1310078.1 TauD/TfdA family dioxygenase [Pseudomonadota bacterium]